MSSMLAEMPEGRISGDTNTILAKIDTFIKAGKTGNQVDYWVEELFKRIGEGRGEPSWAAFPSGASYYKSRIARAKRKKSMTAVSAAPLLAPGVRGKKQFAAGDRFVVLSVPTRDGNADWFVFDKETRRSKQADSRQDALDWAAAANRHPGESFKEEAGGAFTSPASRLRQSFISR